MAKSLLEFCVDVYHGPNPTDHVATVACPYDTVDEALEYAWRWTQNIDGSWSKYGDPDWNPNVKRIAALPSRMVNGVKHEMGLRSSMMGDRMIVTRSPSSSHDGEIYTVAAIGFEKTGQVVQL